MIVVLAVPGAVGITGAASVIATAIARVAALAFIAVAAVSVHAVNFFTNALRFAFVRSLGRLPIIAALVELKITFAGFLAVKMVTLCKVVVFFYLVNVVIFR